MKNKFLFILLFILGLIITSTNSCKKDETKVNDIEVEDVKFTLTTVVQGNGTVNPIEGEYVKDEQVSITATPNNGYLFLGWTGDITSSHNPLVISMDANKSINATFISNTVSDIENIVYPCVVIGTQAWMAKNLKTTHYVDGTVIPNVTNATTWSNLTTPAYCWYNNDANYAQTYGALYNWYAVETGKLCPTGWHVPTNDEWTTLATYLGGANVAGGKLKETGTSHWLSPNTGATNEIGFTALPGGFRHSGDPVLVGYDGKFYYINESGNWWSATKEGTDYAWQSGMSNNSSYLTGNIYNNQFGFSVRCIRN